MGGTKQTHFVAGQDQVYGGLDLGERDRDHDDDNKGLYTLHLAPAPLLTQQEAYETRLRRGKSVSDGNVRA